LARRNNQRGITNMKIDSQPPMPYIILRNMSPHYDSHANSGIPGIKGLTHRFYNSKMNTDTYTIDLQSLQLLHLLPHLQYNDVGTWMESRGNDLQTLARAIMNRTGRSLLSSPNHSTTQRLIHLAEIPLQQERRQFGITAATVINILCKTDPPDTNTADRAPSTDYLGHPIGQPGRTGVDNWGNLNRSETGWGNWFGIIAQVCKAWNEAAQKRRSNPSHIKIHDWHGVVEDWETYGGRILREIKTSYKTYAKLHSIYVSNGAIQSKSQAHKLINLLYDLVPTLKKLHMPDKMARTCGKSLPPRPSGGDNSLKVSWRCI